MMALKVLVVEDIDTLYKRIIRELKKILLTDDFEFTNVDTLSHALDALEKDWDVVIMDYYLGAAYGARDEVVFKDGGDLIAYRRGLEAAEPRRKKSHILGFSGSDDCNDHMVAVGADCSFLKFDISDIAERLDAWYKESG